MQLEISYWKNFDLTVGAKVRVSSPFSLSDSRSVSSIFNRKTGAISLASLSSLERSDYLCIDFVSLSEAESFVSEVVSSVFSLVAGFKLVCVPETYVVEI